MPSFYKKRIPIIEASRAAAALVRPAKVGFGLVPRDYKVHPERMFAPPSDMDLIPENEWDARYDEQEKTESSLEHLYLSGPNNTPAFDLLSQAGFPDCWAHSTLHAVMLDRLKRGLPVVRFNGVAIATLLRQTDGGWCGLSAKFCRERGCPVIGTGKGQWPYQSRNGKDSPELRAMMAKYKIEEEFTDLTREVYNQNLTRAQIATCGFNNIPGPRDYYWWAHSVCGVRWVRIEGGSWGQLILNSWPNWGHHGLAVIRGSKAVPDGAMAVRLTSSAV